MKITNNVWIKLVFTSAILLLATTVGASESETASTTMQPAWHANIFYVIGFIVALGVLPSLINITVFYKDKSDLMLSFAAISVPILILFVFTMFAGKNPTPTEQYLIVVPVVLITCALWFRVVQASCQANNSILKGLLVVPAKIILALFWVFLLYGAMLGNTRKDRRTFAFMMALFTPLLYLLVNGKAVTRTVEASRSEPE